jgi:hypothetical protein
MNKADKIKVVHLALSMLGVPIFIHLSYIKLYDNHVNSFLNTISSISVDIGYKRYSKRTIELVKPNDYKHIAVTIKSNDYKHIAIVCVVRMHIG